MKIRDVLRELTIQPLRRLADAWQVESVVKAGSRDVFEQAIIGRVDKIDNDKAVAQRLAAMESEIDYVRFGHAERLLRLLLNRPGYMFVDEAEVINTAMAQDVAFHEYARAGTSLRHLEPRTMEIYQAVLEVAWQDRISADEYRLIKRLQRKLNISRRDHHVLEIQTADLLPLSAQEAQQALRDLAYFGFVCNFRLRGITQVVIPEEIALRLRNALGIALQSTAYRNLAAKLSMATVKKALESAGQPSVALRKDVLVERLIDGDVPPANLLDQVDNDALDSILAELRPEKPPSMRAVKIRHIINHYDELASRAVEGGTDADPDKAYYDFIVELASRKYDILRASGIIQNDQNVDRAFERGVRFAFSSLLGHPAIDFSGNAHADGGITPSKGRMVLWDCKSALQPYDLTEARCAQFLQYIHREAPNIVSPFLIFSGGFTADSEARALTLKTNCPPGTEIVLLSAANLKVLADTWNKDHPSKRLPIDVLAHTGQLDQGTLQTRVKLFASRAEERDTK